MDRNLSFHNSIRRCLVALRKESVDRNHVVLVVPDGLWVALRKESVDRNYIIKITEITPTVALRKESVDRNQGWVVGQRVQLRVALRKESVDRNC